MGYNFAPHVLKMGACIGRGWSRETLRCVTIPSRTWRGRGGVEGWSVGGRVRGAAYLNYFACRIFFFFLNPHWHVCLEGSPPSPQRHMSW